MKNNIFLGINWEQNSTACLMINGKIINSVSEERFSRIKNDERYPKKAIDFILKNNNLVANDIDKVLIISKYWSPSYILTRHYTNFSISDYLKEQYDVWYKRLYLKKKISFLKVFKKKIDLHQYPGKKFWSNKISFLQNNIDHVSNKKILKFGQKIRKDVVFNHLKINQNKIEFIDHSFGHAAYAYCSGELSNKNASVFTLDAFGDFVNYSCYLFNYKKKISFKKITSGSNFIIGRLYRYTTLILGLKPNEHEYKIMGMAPYCKEHYLLPLLKKLKLIQEVKQLKYIYLKKPKDNFFYFKKLFESFRFDTIAGGIQAYTEYLINNWILNCLSKTKTYNIGLSGGVAMNVKANYEICKNKKINTFYVPPSPDDSSQAMGACYAYCLQNNIKTEQLKNAYLGSEINTKTTNEFLKKINPENKKKYLFIKKKINLNAAKLLKNNAVICRAVGKAEFGARALGNRSILANPSNIESINKINQTIKNRDFWMPFAATILDNKANLYLKIKNKKINYKFMTNCIDTKSLGEKKLKAGIHPMDKTCRAQILNKETNKEYYDLIKKFGNLSNTYALLNTSFNTHGNPIVNCENDAFEIFEKNNLDALILPGVLIVKRK